MVENNCSPSPFLLQENFDRDMEHDALKELLTPLFGEISYISIPRNEWDRTPKGFCFVEFASNDLAEKFLSFMQRIHDKATAIDAETAELLAKASPANRKQLNKITAMSK